MSRFISLWTDTDRNPKPVEAAALESTEHRLRTRLPSDYRAAVLEFGLPHPTIELLDAICDRDLDQRDMSEFLEPNEIVETTEGWRNLGLPEELVAFATDCIGNLFCFPVDQSMNPQQPVFFWDHDSKDVDSVAPSFSAWIDDFCRIAPN